VCSSDLAACFVELDADGKLSYQYYYTEHHLIYHKSFLFFTSSLGAAGTFWLYGLICVLGFAFILVKLPETRGHTLEQIEGDLATRR